MRLKLQPELVPRPLWGVSAYRVLGRGAAWRAIRLDTLEAASNRCAICRSPTAPLSCHEKWHYDDGHGRAMLEGFTILCRNCDTATHMGRAVAHSAGDIALRQICRVNNLSRHEADRLFGQAMARWRRRSRMAWTVAVHAQLLRAYPQLQALIGRKGKPHPA
jgi:hypothetical protein